MKLALIYNYLIVHLYNLLIIGLLSGLIFFCSCNKESNIYPNIEVISPYEGQEFFYGDSIFINISANDPDGSIYMVGYSINGISIDSSLSNIYKAYLGTDSLLKPKKYLLQAYCIDDMNNRSLVELEINIIEKQGHPPVSNFFADSTTGFRPFTVSFIDSSINSPDTWLWKFGDESTSSDKSPIFTFNNPGFYTVTLTTSNKHGSNTIIKQNFIHVLDPINHPKADFMAETSTGAAPLTVSFIDKSLGEPTNWKWKFGDGYESISQNPIHTYNQPGEYTVVLITSNEFGVDSLVKENFVLVSEQVTGCNGITSVEDKDGNVYNTVEIGDQCWLKENLKVGSMISGSNQMLDNNVIEKYCFNNLPENCEIYGALYQWDEVMQYQPEAIQGICPDGWHVPTNEEWSTLVEFLGGPFEAGGHLKEVGIENWDSPNTGATNQSDFTGIPGGYINNNFYGFRRSLIMWSSTEYNQSSAYSRVIHNNSPNISITSDYNKLTGRSVRCIKD